jgi:hypothetical protein
MNNLKQVNFEEGAGDVRGTWVIFYGDIRTL